MRSDSEDLDMPTRLQRKTWMMQTQILKASQTLKGPRNADNGNLRLSAGDAGAGYRALMGTMRELITDMSLTLM